MAEHRFTMLAALLVVAAASSQLVVDLWRYQEAPDHVKAALVLGGVSFAALGILGMTLLRRR